MVKRQSLVYPGTLLFKNEKDDLMHEPLDKTHIQRNVCIDNQFRYEVFGRNKSHVDQAIFYARDIRPMTQEELILYAGNIIPDVYHVDHYCSFFTGDIVLIYKEEVHGKKDLTYEMYEYKVTESLIPNSIDVGIVIAIDSHFAVVYQWKKSRIINISCSNIYWLKNVRGNVVRFPDASNKFDYITPKAMMQSLFCHIEPYLS